MSAMKIENDTMFVTTVSGSKSVHNTQEGAIDVLREEDDIESSDVSIVEVELGEEDWSIAELPWQNVALQLLGE